MRIFKTGWSEGYDGPGRRWMVHLKGCNMRCRWCANPEGISAEPEMLFYAQRGAEPAQACPHGAVDKNGGPQLNRKLCSSCPDRACTSLWKHPAFEFAGESMTPKAIIENACRYRPLFGDCGGVTFGGGEPALQAEELLETLAHLGDASIHTAVETNAATPGFESIVGRTNLLICDLKCVSPAVHRNWTGEDNEIILQNITMAAKCQGDLLIRIPLIFGMNDTAEEAARIAGFLGDLSRQRVSLPVELLPMHHRGEPKYYALGLDYPMCGAETPQNGTVERVCRQLTDKGIKASVARQRIHGGEL